MTNKELFKATVAHSDDILVMTVEMTNTELFKATVAHSDDTFGCHC